jgi:hypothetical protein
MKYAKGERVIFTKKIGKHGTIYPFEGEIASYSIGKIGVVYYVQVRGKRHYVDERQILRRVNV